MANEPTRRVVRVDKLELAELPLHWSNGERGQYLRLLLQFKGIDPSRFFRIDYYPHRHCWLVSQEAGGAASPGVALPPLAQADDTFYLQAVTEFRRTALTAFAALAAQSVHFAQFGCHYELPPEQEEITPAELVKMLGGPGEGQQTTRFTSEGGWQARASEN